MPTLLNYKATPYTKKEFHGKQNVPLIRPFFSNEAEIAIKAHEKGVKGRSKLFRWLDGLADKSILQKAGTCSCMYIYIAYSFTYDI